MELKEIYLLLDSEAVIYKPCEGYAKLIRFLITMHEDGVLKINNYRLEGGDKRFKDNLILNINFKKYRIAIDNLQIYIENNFYNKKFKMFFSDKNFKYLVTEFQNNLDFDFINYCENKERCWKLEKLMPL